MTVISLLPLPISGTPAASCTCEALAVLGDNNIGLTLFSRSKLSAPDNMLFHIAVLLEAEGLETHFTLGNAGIVAENYFVDLVCLRIADAGFPSLQRSACVQVWPDTSRIGCYLIRTLYRFIDYAVDSLFLDIYLQNLI